jgi:hypothetical protein
MNLFSAPQEAGGRFRFSGSRQQGTPKPDPADKEIAAPSVMVSIDFFLCFCGSRHILMTIEKQLSDFMLER